MSSQTSRWSPAAVMQIHATFVLAVQKLREMKIVIWSLGLIADTKNWGLGWLQAPTGGSLGLAPVLIASVNCKWRRRAQSYQKNQNTV